jgi:hypothetical protein
VPTLATGRCGCLGLPPHDGANAENNGWQQFAVVVGVVSRFARIVTTAANSHSASHGREPLILPTFRGAISGVVTIPLRPGFVAVGRDRDSFSAVRLSDEGKEVGTFPSFCVNRSNYPDFESP